MRDRGEKEGAGITVPAHCIIRRSGRVLCVVSNCIDTGWNDFFFRCWVNYFSFQLFSQVIPNCVIISVEYHDHRDEEASIEMASTSGSKGDETPPPDITRLLRVV
ncbi:hypothetical protein EVAR_41208_1 [Eumeta japonica]|uniref:Uncharacterized protein n=1 Tax=Eumeta variegata TaxID=151549 RepID=A0A4C1WQ07_EUMVA|nr:hypothetical protein EVAR_41208_1 [Eumeta japonica]